MMPQIHFNFGPTSFDHFYQAFLPLIPGGVFTGGLLIAHPQLALSLRNALGVSPYVSLAALVFVAYVVGFVLSALSAILTGVVSGIAQGVVFRSWTPARSSWLLSQCTVWRKVAARFLGDELTPALPQTPPASSVVEKITAPMKNLTNKQQHDAEWEEWYRILQDYLLRSVPLVSNETAFGWVILEATGWAFVVVSFMSPHARHWGVYLAAAPLILYGAFFPFVATLGYLTAERLNYWDFTARLLAEVQAHQTPRMEASQVKEDSSG